MTDCEMNCKRFFGCTNLSPDNDGGTWCNERCEKEEKMKTCRNCRYYNPMDGSLHFCVKSNCSTSRTTCSDFVEDNGEYWEEDDEEDITNREEKE